MRQIRIGIDASNLRAGGGVTHLVELLRVADPAVDGFSQVIVWGARATLDQIADRSWLVKSPEAVLERGLIRRALWQRFTLSALARECKCDVLFVPGGAFAGSFRPIVTMSRNMQPFDFRELRRHGMSLTALRLLLLRWTQTRSFRRADGLIFLTSYARDAVMAAVKSAAGEITIVPHGVDERFLRPPAPQLPLSDYSAARPMRVLYVSIVNVYKHQWHVVEAVALLRKSGLPVMLELIGPAHPPALARLKSTLERFDPDGQFVHYAGAVARAELPTRYANADLCLFASSCENMPNILLEGMASGLPIACSDRLPMPEVLGGAGVYFDPENPQDIARALRQLIESRELREKLANASFARVREYSWVRCARDTFQFLSAIRTGM